MSELKNKRIAILVANGFEQSEMAEPRKALLEAGATVDLISPEKGKVKGWSKGNWADEFAVDIQLDEAIPDDYDGLVLPGGVINPDTLRINNTAMTFIKTFVDAQKPIAAICHGPWPLINAGMVRDYKMTSWPSLMQDLKNAGAKWVDEEVVVDRNLVTSRKPQDLPAFNREIIKLFAKETVV